MGAEESCPPSLKFLSVSVLPDGRSGAVGCPGSPWARIRVEIKYEVRDQEVGLTALEGATAAYFTRSRPLRHRPHRLAHIPPHLRSLLDETGAPLKMQQELMRHADIRTAYVLLVRYCS